MKIKQITKQSRRDFTAIYDKIKETIFRVLFIATIWVASYIIVEIGLVQWIRFPFVLTTIIVCIVWVGLFFKNFEW
jgi:hypothetical protein